MNAHHIVVVIMHYVLILMGDTIAPVLTALAAMEQTVQVSNILNVTLVDVRLYLLTTCFHNIHMSSSCGNHYQFCNTVFYPPSQLAIHLLFG